MGLNQNEFGKLLLSSDGNLAFITCQNPYIYQDVNNVIIIIDLSEPASPFIIGIIDTPGNVYGMAISKDL